MITSAVLLDRILERYEHTHAPVAVNLAGRLFRRNFQGGWGMATLRKVQQLRLQRTMAYAARNSPFYHDLYQRHGVAPHEVRKLGDLGHLPFTTAADLIDWRRLQCVPDEDLAALYTTSGTTGEPKRACFSRNDVQAMTNLGAATLRAGLSGRLVALIALPMRHGLWIGWRSAMEIVQRAGGLALPIGAGDQASTLRWIQSARPTVIFSSPSYLTALTRAAEQEGYRTHISQVWLSGEPLFDDQRERIADYWRTDVMNVYGTTEIGGAQAFQRPGCRAFHLNPLNLIAEIVDPKTGEPAWQGELVYTTLLREAMPLIRYRSGDLGAWTDCDCRIPLPAIRLLGRADDMLLAADMNLYAANIAAAVGQVAGADGRVRLQLDHVDMIDHMTLYVAGRGIRTEEVRVALYALHPEMPESVNSGSLLLTIDCDADLGDQTKSVTIQDRRAST